MISKTLLLSIVLKTDSETVRIYTMAGDANLTSIWLPTSEIHLSEEVVETVTKIRQCSFQSEREDTIEVVHCHSGIVRYVAKERLRE